MYSALSLTPSPFSASTTSYTATVANATTHVKLTPTANESNAKMAVLRPSVYMRVTSGNASDALALAVGANKITVWLTAQDGKTNEFYTVTVTRQGTGDQSPQQQQRAGALTASFERVPAGHDGAEWFGLDVRFSEALGEGGVAPTGKSFAVTGGTVKRVRQVEAGLWRVRVAPNSWRDVKVTLAGGRGCDAKGAVCAAGGRALSNDTSASVAGPARIQLTGGKAREGRDATLDFAVALSRAAAHAVSVDYATADGTAGAGADYTAASGTLTFAPGETAKTVAVAILDDAIDEGKEKFTLRLSNPQGAYLRNMHREATGTIRNSDPLQKMWLSRFGRMVGSQVSDAVAERLVGGLSPGAHATLAGQRVDLSRIDDGKMLAETLTGLVRAFGPREAPANDEPFARHGLGDVWNEPATTGARRVTGRELLLGSAFHVASKGEGPGPALAAWGRVAHGRFDGGEASGDGRMRIDGEVLTGVLGADAEWNHMLTGVAVSLSEGEGTFEQPGVDKGSIESRLTTVSPYARVRLTGRLSAWGLVGFGTGDMTITQDARPDMVTKTDIGMQMGALGARGALLEQSASGGMDLALRADAFFVRVESEKAANSVETTADASRVRLVLEGGRRFAFTGAAALRPSLELGLRYDGGDAETGTGLELGGGVAYADAASGLSIETRARVLVAHTDSDYEEWGASASVRYAPRADGRGLSLHAGSSWGAASEGAERLWSQAAGLSGGNADPGARLDAEVAWGFDVPHALLTPYAGVSLAESGKTWRAGARWKPGPAYQVNLEASLTEPANDDRPGGGVLLRGSRRW